MRRKRIGKRTVDQLSPLERAIYEELSGPERVYNIGQLSSKYGRSPQEIRDAFAAAREAGAKGKLAERIDVPEAFQEDIVRVPKERARIIDTQGYDASHTRIGLTADSHLGSVHHTDVNRKGPLHDFYKLCANEGYSIVLHGGNWLDGNARFNRTTSAWGFSEQMKIFLYEYPYVEGVTTLLVGGDDHEGWWWQREGIDVVEIAQALAEKYGRHDLVFGGYIEFDMALIPGKGLLYNSYREPNLEDLTHLQHSEDGEQHLHGIKPYPKSTLELPKNGKYAIIRNMHAGGGTAYAKSLRPQKIIESWEGGEKPQFVNAGHYHKASYDYIRNVHFFQSGCAENQSDFMRKRAIVAEVGNWLVDINQDTDTGAITSLEARFIPYIGRGMVFDPRKWTRRLNPRFFV
ncbi:hypothetical protein D6789_03300 [Candidatus Woesearchaeota archaeon]|nr:MAG: hypothetical protein D6789_03300 [Candidatus Woesearchaeota archaeon]